jgi:predicted metalloprotease with PDZ domain
MNTRLQYLRFQPIVALTALLLGASAYSQDAPIKLDVDATDAPRKVLHTKLRIPAQPGSLTLLYPKWIPGEHGPTGPVNDLVGLEMSAAGRSLTWQRDPEDMYAFHVVVPASANVVEISLDFLLQSILGGDGGSSAAASAQLLDLNWNEVLLYPAGRNTSELSYAPTLRLPAGWKFGTALTPASEGSARIEFAPVSLETLVDSPLLAGAHFRTVELSPGQTPPHLLHIAADSEGALEIKPEDTRRFGQLVAEAGALFGARHYRAYHFLLTLSDHVAHFGLEHHESSDDRESEKYLVDEDARKLGADLLPHEMAHSWNGKYRRPAGLATPDFQKPMNTELLWVYEGLTDYLGDVLAARCGLWSSSTFREYLALEAATLENAPGRKWRSLADTAIAAQILYGARADAASWRRGVDFYSEGAMIWLEADVLIRQQTEGRRSLDDFCRRFFGGQNTPPKIITYTLDDVVATLNEVAPSAWREFFQMRVYAPAPHAPLGGITGAGWRLSYTNAVTDLLKSRECARKYTDLRFSLGLLVKEDGSISDVIPGSPANTAGIGVAMKEVGVNGRRWTSDILRAAIKSASTNTTPIELLLENEDYFKTVKVAYHNGEKYPQLERDKSKPDLLAELLRSRTLEAR